MTKESRLEESARPSTPRKKERWQEVDHPVCLRPRAATCLPTTPSPEPAQLSSTRPRLLEAWKSHRSGGKIWASQRTQRNGLTPRGLRVGCGAGGADSAAARTKPRSRPCVRGGPGKAPGAEKASRAGMPPSEVRKGPSSNAESFKSRYYKGASVRRLRYSPRFDAGERGLRGSSQKVRAEEHGLCPTEGGTSPPPPVPRAGQAGTERERPVQTGLLRDRVCLKLQTPCRNIP